MEADKLNMRVSAMDIAEARGMVAQIWCLPETSDIAMDVRLAEPMARLLHGWIEVAAGAARDRDYYRGVVVEIGALFGEAAKTADDGVVHQEVLCAKVPELVRALLARP